MKMNNKTIYTISQQVYEILKDEICSGEYHPGAWLQEKEVAQKLNVSRSPVREALRRLEADGLVQEIPNKGVFVRDFSGHDIEDIFEVREAIENYAIVHMKNHLNPEVISHLQNLIKQFEMYYGLDDLDNYIVVDEGFHRYLVSCSGNQLMLNLYDKVKLMNQRFRVYSLKSRQRFDESLQEHRSILQNILDGNYEKACEINTTHLTLAKQKIIEYLDSIKEEPAKKLE